MRIKLDENLGLLGKALLEADGHDVMTITEQPACDAQRFTPISVPSV
jgi:hypothetical protein